MRAVHVTIIFCSSCGCLWECVTVKTRFCRSKKLSIFILINIFCGLERSIIIIRNIWVTEAKYSCAIIELRWFAIGDLVAVQAPVELKNISIFPRWSRDVVSYPAALSLNQVTATHMGEVTKEGLSCYLVLLSW